ncbi:MAG: ribonuclease HI [Deltaproteobacteria bacterium]|nr:ribonuclease HI [Deltaproteobacteria bacterium]
MTTSPHAATHPQVDAWCDGACRGNPGPGGWGVVLRWGEKEKELSGGEPDTTNNRMELTAAIQVLLALKKPCRITIHTDSQYVVKGMTVWSHGWRRNGWRNSQKKAVENRDLWEALLSAAAPHQVHWQWVRGHAGDPMNERVDALATAAAAAV